MAARGQVPAALLKRRSRRKSVHFHDTQPMAERVPRCFTRGAVSGYELRMTRFIKRGLCVAAWLAGVMASCGGSQKKSDVPEGHKVCQYCCTTANSSCSCVVMDVVECPAPDNTGILPACAECRNCTRAIGPEESCSAE